MQCQKEQQTVGKGESQMENKTIYHALEDPAYQDGCIDKEEDGFRSLPDGMKVPFHSVHGGFREKKVIKTIYISCCSIHIHILLQYPPGDSIRPIVSILKQERTYHIWRTHHHKMLAQHDWAERPLWSDGSFAASVGDALAETFRQYIASQG